MTAPENPERILARAVRHSTHGNLVAERIGRSAVAHPDAQEYVRHDIAAREAVSIPGWVDPGDEVAWPDGFDSELTKRLDLDREDHPGLLVPAWLRSPSAGLLAVELLSGASELYECAGWSQTVIELVVAAAKRSLVGEVEPIEGFNGTIDPAWIGTIGRLCELAGGFPSDHQHCDLRSYVLFDPVDPPMVWETETVRRESVIRKQMAQIERMAVPWNDDRKRDAMQRALRPWLRMLLRSHGEERVVSRRIDRGEQL